MNEHQKLKALIPADTPTNQWARLGSTLCARLLPSGSIETARQEAGGWRHGRVTRKGNKARYFRPFHDKPPLDD